MKKERSEQKTTWQPNRLDGISNDFVISNGTTVNTMVNEALESQVYGHHKNFERMVDTACQNQIKAGNTDDEIRNAVDSAVFAVKYCMHDATLTAMNNLVIPRVEMAARLITGSPENGINSIGLTPDRRECTGNTEITPHRSDSSRLDLKIEQNEIDETRDSDNSEDSDFYATRSMIDWRAHAHHNLKLTFRTQHDPKNGL